MPTGTVKMKAFHQKLCLKGDIHKKLICVLGKCHFVFKAFAPVFVSPDLYIIEKNWKVRGFHKFKSQSPLSFIKLRHAFAKKPC